MLKQKAKRWANVTICLFFFLLFSPLATAESIYTTLDTPFYDPNSTDCSADSSIGGAIGTGNGDAQALAQQIISNSNISYDYGPSGITATQFKRLASGQQAQTDDGRGVSVQPIILITILRLAQGHQVNVSALTDGVSHTAPSNPHGSGKAVDINIFDGGHTNGSDSVATNIINAAASVLPANSRFGMGNGPFGSKQIDGKNFISFTDNPTHVHIDVMGVSQEADDAAVQAAGLGTDSSGGASCCTNPSAPGTELIGSGAGEQVYNFFAVTHHLSNESAAAATGNLQLESANWSAIDGWGGGGGNYYGIGQWSRNDRYPNLVKFAGGTENAAKLNYQLDFVWYELTTSYQSTLANLRGNSSLGDKTIFWGRNYEVAVTNGQLQLQDQRIAYALVWAQRGSGAAGPADATGDTSGASDTRCSGGDTTAAGPDGYSNPFHDMSNLIPSRIDEGVDYVAKAGTTVPVYALGNGVVTKVAKGNSTFYSKLPNWITYQLKDGSASGKYVYVAEGCVPLVSEGDNVTSSTVLCNATPESIETGWALDATSQAALAYSVYGGHDGYETAYGVNFNELLTKLGAPGGHLDTSSDPSGAVLGNLPADWPKWK